MTKRFAIAGMIIGLVIGLSTVVRAYLVAPGMPGPLELAIQVVIVGLLGGVGTIAGFVLGLVASIFRRQRK